MGLKFGIRRFIINVEDRDYEALIDDLEILSVIENVASEAGLVSGEEKEKVVALMDIVREAVNAIFGETAFDDMTEDVPLNLDICLQLFEFLVEEFNRYNAELANHYQSKYKVRKRYESTFR